MKAPSLPIPAEKSRALSCACRLPRCLLCSSRARKWEMARYRAYQAQLAGQPIGEAFSQATAFLCRAVDGSFAHTG